MLPEAVRVLAPAKVNLTLEILGRRTDGYHNLASIMHTLELADEIVIRRSDQPGLTCSEPALATDNLAWRAVEAMAQLHRRPVDVVVDLHKRIPISGGLGGGSSDAAAVIRGLCALWGLPFEPGEYVGLAAQLGSDVPFFLFGGAALVEGRGERITPLPSLPSLPVMLLPGAVRFERKTAALFQRLRPEHWGDGRATARLLRSWPDAAALRAPSRLVNTFEAIADEVFGDFAARRGAALAAGARSVHLSGAGPTLFALPEDNDDAEAIAAALRQSAPTPAIVTRFDGLPAVVPIAADEAGRSLTGRDRTP